MTAKLQLKVQTTMEGGTGWRAMAPGPQLRPGETYGLEAVLDQAGFLYVFHVAPEGARRMLRPATAYGDASVKANVLINLPEQHELYKVGDRRGTETLIVIASLRPLSPAELDGAIADLPRGREPPPGERDTRGRDPDLTLQKAWIDEDVIVALKFPIFALGSEAPAAAEASDSTPARVTPESQ
jgi:hypothetical protein